MIPKPLADITEADLQNLVTTGVEESITLEFKRQLVGADRDARKEFVADICALANTQGGDIIFGLSENDDGIASNIVPQQFSPDAEILRLTNMLNDGLEPKLHGVIMRAVDIAGGRALVIRVPRAFAGIHRAKADGQFWVRESRSKRGLDIYGIRSRFSDLFGREDRYAEFFARRYVDILSNTYPLKLTVSPKVVLHIVPNRPFLDGEELDISELSQAGNYWTMPNNRSGFCTHTFEGVLHHRPVGNGNGEVRGTTLIFRSGLVEAVSELVAEAEVVGDESWIYLEQIEALFVQFLQTALAFTIERLALGYPVTLKLAVVGASQYRAQTMDRELRWHFENQVRVHTPVLQLPDIYLEESPSSIPVALQTSFDRLWQAWGFPKSYCFKADNEGRIYWQDRQQ